MHIDAGRSRFLLAGGLGALLLVTACSGAGHKPASTATSSTTTTAAAKPTQSGPVPLTGGPVLAVKEIGRAACRERV